ncbi:MAG: T9SS type A sorting domain-containing protein, partial [Bacteroidales bacterium]|nr:T9SS type A sorting domain-containing protein [Bacteroidales bacterium]
ATGYIISFENDAIPVVKGAVDDSGEGSIVIPIPEGLLSGEYKGTVTFNVDEEYYYPATYPITITADITPAVAVQLYTDMLIADNHDGRFTSYQWYKDGSPIDNATHGYYYEKKLGGKYTVELTTTDGDKFMSCPVKLISAKALAQSVKAYPNPARRGETFAVEIADYDPAQEYSIMIFSANGLLVKKLTNVEQTTEMSLPTGVYSGSLISGGSKYGFKLIVE